MGYLRHGGENSRWATSLLFVLGYAGNAVDQRSHFANSGSAWLFHLRFVRFQNSGSRCIA